MNRRRFLGSLLGGWAAARLGGWTRVSDAVAGRLGGAERATARATEAAPGAAAKPPAAAAPPAGGCKDGLAVARQQVLRYCTDVTSPNNAMHGVRALGRDCPLGGGDPFRVLLENLLEETQLGERTLLEVPAEREGHHNAMMKTLIEKGCEPELQFHLHGRPYTFHDVIESTRLLTTYPGHVAIDEHSWTIIGLAQVIPRAQARWRNIHGQPVDLERMIDDTSAALLADTQLVRSVDLRRADLPRDCPALGRACGGLHMLYALAVAEAHGYSTPARRQAFAQHMRTHMRRLVYDIKVIDEVVVLNRKAGGEDSARLVDYDSKIKFWGHSFEVFAVVERHGLYRFAPEERRQVQDARAALCQLLAGGGDLDFSRYRNDRYQYESLTGGVCHAYNGLMLMPA